MVLYTGQYIFDVQNMRQILIYTSYFWFVKYKKVLNMARNLGHYISRYWLKRISLLSFAISHAPPRQ